MSDGKRCLGGCLGGVVREVVEEVGIRLGGFGRGWHCWVFGYMRLSLKRRKGWPSIRRTWYFPRHVD